MKIIKLIAIVIGVFSISGYLRSQTVEVEVAAEAMTKEIILKAVVIDASSDYIQIQNSTTTDAQFIPLIRGHHESDERQALDLVASTTVERDVSSTRALMRFDSRISPATGTLNRLEAVNRPIFSWHNYTSTKMLMSAEGYLGLGTEDPKSKLQISEGDVYIEDIDKGVILTSPDGSCWRITVEDDGTLTTSTITCP